ncbi:unnamed protein product [Heterobilharzia americana]|nr:unnamed protein product [Heterobilharzia americana]
MTSEVGAQVIIVKSGKRIIDPKHCNFLSNSVPVGIEATENLHLSLDNPVSRIKSEKSLQQKSCHRYHHHHHHPIYMPEVKYSQASNSYSGYTSNTVELLQPTCCHILVSGERIKSVSVDHLRCLDQAVLDCSHVTSHLKKSFISCDRLHTSLTDRNIPVGSRSAGDGQTDNDDDDDDDDHEFDGTDCPTYPENISYKNNPVSSTSSKVEFHLDSSSDELYSPSISFTNDQTDIQHHLLLPGRSTFEKHLVREVAYFELCEFLIEQMEEIYDTETYKLLLSSEINQKHNDRPSQMHPDHQITLIDTTIHKLDNPLTQGHQHIVNTATGLAISLVNMCIENTNNNGKSEIISYWVDLDEQSTNSNKKTTILTYNNKLQRLFKSFSFSKTNQYPIKSLDNSIELTHQSLHAKSFHQPMNSKLTVQSRPQSSYLSLFLNSFNSIRHPGTSASIVSLKNTSMIELDNPSVKSTLKQDSNCESLISLINNFKFSDKLNLPFSKHHSSVDFVCTPLPFGLLINPPVLKSKRKAILASQNNRCAGCGAFIETRYLKRMRFCEFFGRYFCCVCHSNTLMTLPGNLLTSWDFRMLPVSNFARDRLHQLHNEPLLRTIDFNKQVLNRQSNNLLNCITLRRQGNLMLPFIERCQAAQQLIDFQSIPNHWFKTPDLWSMADLHTVHNGKLSIILRNILLPIVEHISLCERCLAQGFICEICKSGQILFPFGQINTIICSNCSACFHRTCLNNIPKLETCPRCIRRAIKREQITIK